MTSPQSAVTADFDNDRWQTGGGKGTPLPFHQTVFALYWNDLPPVAVTKNNSNTDNDTKGTKLKIDGHSVRGRMAVYRYLIENSHCNAIPSNKEEERKDAMCRVWGRNLERHFLWGYGALMDWEARSGRLSLGEDYTPRTQNQEEKKENDENMNGLPIDKISPDSWWGYVNFCYNVCVLLGAVKAGVLDCQSIDDVELDRISSERVANDPVVKEVIEAWSIFWKRDVTTFVSQTLAIVDKSKPQQEGLSSTPELECLYDTMNKEEWGVHSIVFKLAVFDETTVRGGRAESLLQKMPNPEQRFSVGFCRIVELMAALNWRTDLVTTLENGPGFMPLKVLDDEVMVEIRNGSSPIEKKRKKTVLDMHKLFDVNDAALEKIALFWGRAGQWMVIRRNIAHTMNTLNHGNGLAKAKETWKVLFFFLLPANTAEVVVWTALLAGVTAALLSRRFEK